MMCFLFGHDQGSIGLFLERNADRLPSLACYIPVLSCQDLNVVYID